MSGTFRKYYIFIFLIISGYYSFSHFDVRIGANPPQPLDSASQEKLLLKSFKLYKFGSTDSSIILLDKIIALSSSEGYYNSAYKALIQKAQILKNQGLFKKASYLLDSFRIEDDNALESARLISKAEVSVSLGYYPKADSFINKSMELINTIGNSILLSRAKIVEADICFYQGRFSEGFKFVEAAFSLYQPTEQNTLHLSEIYNVKGKLYFGKKDYVSALNYFGKALEIREHYYGSNHPETAKLIHNIGSTYYDMSDLTNAEYFLKKALDIRIKTLGETNPSTADSYNNLGNLYQASGELDLAEAFLSKALKIRKETLGRFNNAVVITYNNLGNVYLDKKKYNEAYQSYLTGLELKSGLSESEDLDNILLYNNLGIVLKQQKRYPEAMSYFRKAVEIETQLLGSYHLWPAFTNLNIGATYRDLKDYEKSREYLFKALDNLKYLPEDNHPLKAELFYELALAAYEEGDMESGLNNLQDAMMIIDPDFNPKSVFDNPLVKSVFLAGELVKTLEKKGEIFLKLSINSDDMKYLKEADEVFKIASVVLDQIRRSYKAESSKLDLSSTSKIIYEKALETSYILYQKTRFTGYLNQAFEYSEKSRSLKLLESIIDTKAKLSGNIPDSLLAYENKLKQACLVFEHKMKAALDNGTMYKSDEVALLNSKLLDLSLQHEKLISRFEKEYPGYYGLKYSIDISGIQEVQDILIDKNQTVIEYFLGERSLYIFLISKIKCDILKLDRPERLNERIQKLRESIVQMDYELYTRYAYELYMEIFNPAEKYLKGPDVIIVPDGILGYIPYEALIFEPAVQNMINYKKLSYLIRKYQFSYSNSCTLLRESLTSEFNPEKDKLGGYAP